MENEKPNGIPDGVIEHSMVAVCQFKCKNCLDQVAARVPQLRVFNFPECSGVIMAHQAMAKCRKCETMYIPLIGEVSEKGEIKFIWRPVSPNKQLSSSESEQSKLKM